MSALKQDDVVEQRLEQVERRLAATIRVVTENESRLGRLEVTHPRRRPVPTLPHVPLKPPATVAPSASRSEPPSPTPPATSLDDFLGGRALAWIGGIATLLGIVLLLGVAISHDWIGPVVRVLLAGVGSTGLLVVGTWLHDRRGRTEAAVASVAYAPPPPARTRRQSPHTHARGADL